MDQGPVYALIKSYHNGDITFNQLKDDFASRDWPAPVTIGSNATETLEFIDVPNGSWTEVYNARDAGLLTHEEYLALADAVG